MAKAPPTGPGWAHEIKHDGFRLMVGRDGERVRLLRDLPIRIEHVLERQVLALDSIPYVEASHLALSKTENVSDRLVSKPVRLPLERFAFKIADGLADLCDDRAIGRSMKAHRFDMRTDHGPLARPVLA
jgi:hypothetical protein